MTEVIDLLPFGVDFIVSGLLFYLYRQCQNERRELQQMLIDRENLSRQSDSLG